jgi:glutaredoxin-related protein
VAQGQYADNCIQGANDAVEYYNSVNGDFDKLKLSYEWAWLKQYFNAKHQK